MAATIEQQIAVKIRTYVEGLAQVQALSASVRGLNRPVAGNGLSATRKQVVDLGTASTTTAGNIATMLASTRNIATGFSNGTRSVKNFTAELGVMARELKPITDASRLLAAPKSIQLPRGFQGQSLGTVTLSPLAQAEKATERIVLNYKAVSDQSRKAANVLAGNAKSLKDSADSSKTLGDNISRIATLLNQNKLTKDQSTELFNTRNAAIRQISALSDDPRGVQAGVALRVLDQMVTKQRAVLKEAEKTSNVVAKTAVKAAGGDDPVKNTRTLTQQFNTATSAVFRLRAAIALVAAAIGAIAAAAGIYALVRGIAEVVQEGVKFNSVLENAKIGLAGIISNTFEIRDANGNLVTGVDAYNAGLALASGQMNKLRAATIETSFEFEDLLASLTQASSAVAGTNTSLEKTVDLVVKLSRVGSAINLSPSELATQSRQVLTGSTRVQTRLAQALFPGEDATAINKQIKAFRDAGTLAEELEKRMAKFQFTANDIANTFTALANNAGDAFKLFAGEATLKVFDQIKQALRFIIDQIVIIDETGVRLTPTFQKVANIFNVMSGQTGKRLMGIIVSIGDFLSRWVGSITASEAELRGVVDGMFEVGRQIVGFIGDFLRFIGLGTAANTNAATLRDLFNAAALAIAFARDLTNAIRNQITLIVNGPLLLMVGFWEAIGGLIDRATGNATRFGQTIANMRRVIQAAFFGGLSGLADPGQETRAAFGNLRENNRVRGEIGGSFEPGFTASPIKSAGGGDAKAAKRKADELRRALSQMFDAIEALQIAGAEREAAIEREKNKLLLDLAQDRFDKGVLSAKDFYKEKQKLDLDDLAKERELLERRKRIATNALTRQIGANIGRAATDADIAAVKNAFRETAGGISTPKDATLARNIKEYADTAKEVVKIDEQLKVIEQQRLGIQQATTREVEKQARINKQNALDIESELADSLGQGGVAAANSLSKRISDEFSKALVEFGSGNLALEVIAEETQAAGSVSFDKLLNDFDLLGIEISELPKPLQDFIKLLDRADKSAAFTKLTSEAEKIQQTLGFGVDGAFKGFELGTSFEVARDTIDSLTTEALPLLEQKYKELVALTSTVSTDGTLLFSPEETEFVNQLGIKVDELKNKVKALQLAQLNSQSATDIADRKIETIQAQQIAGTLSQIQAEKQIIAVKKDLIGVYQQELAALLAINEAARSREQSLQVIDLQNKIATLNNEINANAINLRDGILNTVGGAFESFFDAVLTGNESILTSFRRIVAGMLAEIAKLIFQTLVWKQIMSLVQAALGGIGGGFGGAAGGGFNPSGPFGMGANFAEGGYTGEGGKFEPAGIVHRGEYVIPANRVKQIGIGWLENIRTGAFLPRMRGYAVGGLVGGGSGSAQGGGGLGRGVRIVNSVDPAMTKDFLESSEGEQVILNIIGKNPGVFQRLVNA